MSNGEKTFDAVAMMRSARDKISTEIEGMTLDEELKWLASQKVDDPFLRRLRERATQQTVATDTQAKEARSAPLTGGSSPTQDSCAAARGKNLYYVRRLRVDGQRRYQARPPLKGLHHGVAHRRRRIGRK